MSRQRDLKPEKACTVLESAQQKLPLPKDILTSEQLSPDSPDLERADLRAKLDALPYAPGVYMMHDARNRVIYVGKSKCLYNRVRSYFLKGNRHTARISTMVSRVADFETIVVSSESEALLLENTLIKKYRPYFNVLFRDDKHYPMLELTMGETFPRLRLARKNDNKESRYFGPFTDSASFKHTKHLIQKCFGLRTCRTMPRDRACLHHHIKLCAAPCIGAVTPEDYARSAASAIRFLSGDSARLCADLQKEMEEESARYNFERCAVLRDMLTGISQVVSQQKVLLHNEASEDYLALVREGDLACASCLQIREGKLTGQRHFVLSAPHHLEDAEVMQAFIQRLWDGGEPPPPQIMLSLMPPQEEVDTLEEWLSGQSSHKVRLRAPQRGLKRQVMEMALRNARDKLNLEAAVPSPHQLRSQAVEDLRRALHLPRLPLRMECMDISNTSGKQPVGSMVVFTEGKPRRTHYRHFKIRCMDTPNDFAMMSEMLERRFSRHRLDQAGQAPSTEEQSVPADAHAPQTLPPAYEKDESLDTLPDLLIVDGGKGQLGMAVEVLRKYALTSQVMLAGLAKREEELFLPGREAPVCLEVNSPAYLMVTHLRNEAHRFAITHHRNLRQKTLRHSALDDIEGIGPKKKRDLLLHLGSLKAIKGASLEDLQRVPGLGNELALRIYRALHD